jgi:hypothetical protein
MSEIKKKLKQVVENYDRYYDLTFLYVFAQLKGGIFE